MNERKPFASMSRRQKTTAVVLVIALVVVIWLLIDWFGGKSSEMSTAASDTGLPGSRALVQSAMAAPLPQPVASLEKQPAGVSPREAALMRLQQETEAKYVALLNQLQILKVQRDIAETNKAIMAAKLDTITSQKGIVNTLTAKPSQPVSTTPGFVSQTVIQPKAGLTSEASYTVVSISQLSHKWSAVVSYEGNLYHVSIGDVLPSDGSKVILINRTGIVIVTKSGERRKISMVPVI